MDSVFKIAAAMRDYLGIPPNLTFWEMANSELIIALATLTIGVVVNRKVGRIGEKVDDNKLGENLTKELEERSSLPLEPPGFEESHTVDLEEATVEPELPDMAASVPPRTESPRPARSPDSAFFGKQANFIEGADLIGKLKEFVDSAAGHVSDGRKKRKYRNLGKRDYRVIILALEDDGVISHPVAAELLTAFDAWRPFSTNTVAVPDDVIALLKRSHNSLMDSNGNLTRRRRRRNV